ncbi:MAG: carbon-nitrogen hydrolase family protein [Candidatus Aureabacteria bacterium]|nr:carbon-nitrogen hydrolase family protein [Candidatus Auribacterota bacterium]
MKSFTAALIQIHATEDTESNLKRLEEGVRRAVSHGALLVCGPEFFCFSGDPEALARHASPVPGPLTARLARLARQYSVYFVPGTIPERGEEDKPFNTLLFFFPDGSLRGKYRKRHLFHADIPGKFRHDERGFISAGQEAAPVLETELGNFGLSICYDLRFPEQYLRLAIAGAEIILVPSAFTKVTGEAHWHTLCKARAIETGCFLLAPNQTGQTGASPERYGHSIIVDPWGEILAEAEEDEDLLCAKLSADTLADARQKLRSIEHRAAGDSVPDSACDGQ